LVGGQLSLLGQRDAAAQQAVAGSHPAAVEEVIERTRISRLEKELQRLRHENAGLIRRQTENLRSPDSWRRFRVYCMVPSIYDPHRYDKLAAVAQTWGKRCDVIKFFIDPAEEGEEFPKYFEVEGAPPIEMVQVPLVRKNDKMKKDKVYRAKSCSSNGQKIACRHIWEKVWRSWVYIADNDLDKADFFFKIDDDSFVFIEFLKLYFEQHDWDPEIPRYFGQVSKLSPVPFVNGAIVGLSRAALRMVAVKYKNMPREYGPRENFAHHRCVDRDGASQEITEAICLNEIGVQATPLVDQHGYSMISLFRLSDSLFLRKRYGTRSWYWYKKPKTVICCSDTPIAVHWYKRPSDLLKIESYLYNPEDLTIDKELYSRALYDALKENPGAKRKAVISDVSLIPVFAYASEIEYLFRVKENLRTLGVVAHPPPDAFPDRPENT